MYLQKNVLHQYLVQSNAYNSLKSAKNVFFFLFCILVDMSMGGYLPTAPTLATLLRL